MEGRSRAEQADRRHWVIIAYQLGVIAPTTAILAIDLVNRPEQLNDPSIIAWGLGVALVDLIPIPAAGGLFLSLSFPILLATAMIYPPSVAGLIAFTGSLDPRELQRKIPVLSSLEALLGRRNLTRTSNPISVS